MSIGEGRGVGGCWVVGVEIEVEGRRWGRGGGEGKRQEGPRR